jgi:hypothetical protein
MQRSYAAAASSSLPLQTSTIWSVAPQKIHGSTTTDTLRDPKSAATSCEDGLGLTKAETDPFPAISSSKKVPKNHNQGFTARNNGRASKSSRLPAVKARTIGSSTTGQTRGPDAPTIPESLAGNDGDKLPAAISAPAELTSSDKAVPLEKPGANSTNPRLRTPSADPLPNSMAKAASPEKADRATVQEGVPSQKTFSEAQETSESLPETPPPDTGGRALDKSPSDLLKGLRDLIRNIVLDEVNKETDRRTASDVDSEPRMTVPASSTEKGAGVDQTTQTEARDRRDRLKDKYRERRRVKRQKDRDQQSQRKLQFKELQEKSSSAPPLTKLNPLAKEFLPPSLGTRVSPSSRSPIPA